jgi:hypothetical protein
LKSAPSLTSILIAALGLLLALQEPGAAQDTRPAEALPGAARAPERDRWEKLSPEERQRLREIYRRLQALPPRERERLLERLRKMAPQERRRVIQAAQERVAEGPAAQPRSGPSRDKRSRLAGAGRPSLSSPLPLAPEVRRRLEKLPPEERAREVDAMVTRSLERWRETLPPDLGERVRRFTRREQVELMRAYRETEVLLKTFPDPAEERALRELTPEKLHLLFRPEAVRSEGAKAEGAKPEPVKPAGISEASWERWLKLKPVDRQLLVRRLNRLRAERPAPAELPAAPGPPAPLDQK